MKSLVLAGVAVMALSSAASASSISFVTPTGATNAGGSPVDAEATFTTGSGTITITLTNLQANPTDVAQAISDLSFTVSSGTTASASITSSSGQQITISGHTGTTGATASTGWGLDAAPSGTIHMDDLGFSGPALLIIGPGPYTNANGSINGNGPHNPFINQSASFTLSVPLVTADTTITSATFSFGTTAGNNVDGCQVGTNGCTPPPPVPEPASLTLLGSGLAFLGARLRRKKA